MKLAWKEIRHSAKKYLLIESILVLMMFMVVFLSGLANGLGWAISASIEKTDAKYFVISTDAEKLISTSNVDKEVLEQVAAQTKDKVTTLSIKRSNINTLTDEKKLDITYFSIDPKNFLSPDVIQGNTISASSVAYPLVLDDSFKDQNIAIGDVVEDSVTGLPLTVVGFAKDELYGHSPVGFIGTDTFTAFNKEINSSYIEKYNAIVVQGSDRMSENMLHMSRLDHQNIVEMNQDVKVDEQIRRCIILLDEKWAEKEVHYELDLEKCSIVGNYDLLFQLWTNLIDNAIKYSNAKSSIGIATKVVDNLIMFSIKDEGIGIPEDKVSRIYEKFYQCDESHKKQGSGLGLSIA